MSYAAASRELPRHFVIHNRHELIQAAAVRVVAIKGFHAATVADICAESHISPKCFYEHFSSVEETVLSAVEAGVDQVMADFRDMVAHAPSWQDGIWDGVEAYADWIACEPAFGRAAVFELLAIGPPGLELLHSLMDAFALFLEPGYQLLEPTTVGMLDQAITGRIFEQLHTHLTHHSPETVPEIVPDLVRIAVGPFLGPDATEDFIARRQAAFDQATPVGRS